jgi:hypothetical protein
MRERGRALPCWFPSTKINVAYASCVELHDGKYLPVPEVDEGGSDGKLHFVDVNQDTEEPQASVANEDKHRNINLCIFKIMQPYMYVCAFTSRSWNETLDAWSLGIYALLLVCYVYAIGPGKSRVMFVTCENRFWCWNYKIFINRLHMWIWAPVLWLSWVKCFNILSTSTLMRR